MYFLYRYSQTPRILTVAVSSKIASHPLWLSRQKEKLRAGSFAGLQRSFWSVRRRRRTKRKKRNRIAAFQMDSQHRTRSTRGCVIAPIHSFFFLMDCPVSYTGYTSHQHSSSLNWQMPSRFSWHQKRKTNPSTREAICTQTHFYDIVTYPPGLQINQKQTWKRSDNAHL